MKFFLAILFCWSANATTYYVRSTGNDTTGNGLTTGTAFATIEKATNVALSNGDVIDVGPGKFSGDATSNAGGITLRGSSNLQTTNSNRLTITHPNWTVDGIVFDGFGDGSTLRTTEIHLQGPNATNTLIKNCRFTVCNPGVAGYNSSGIPSYITVRSNVFDHHISNGAVTVLGDHWTIENNIFKLSVNDATRIFGSSLNIKSNLYQYIRAPDDTGMNATSASSVTIGTGAKTFTIEAGKSFTAGSQLTIYSVANPTVNSMTGIVTDYSGTTLSITIYAVAGSGTFSDWGITTGTSNVNGNHADLFQSFETSLSNPSTNVVIAFNRMENCSSQLGNLENNAANDMSGDWLIYNNVFWNCRIQLNSYLPDLKFLNNSVYNTGGYALGIAARDSGGTKGQGIRQIVKNNIFIHAGTSATGQSAYSLQTGGEGDYNILTTDSDGAFSSYSEVHGYNGTYTPSQVFKDVSTGDLTLIANAPAIGHGTDLSGYFTTDYTGATRSTWDIGAYQYTVAEQGGDGGGTGGGGATTSTRISGEIRGGVIIR